MSTRLVVRRIVVTVSLVGGIFLAVENLWAILRPAPQLELSPSTTWITEPLAADGLPDYFQAVMDMGPRGIPPEINAAAAVWELIPSASEVTTVRVTFWTDQYLRLGKAAEFGRSGWWKRRWKSALKGLREAVESGEIKTEPVTVAGGNRVPGAA